MEEFLCLNQSERLAVASILRLLGEREVRGQGGGWRLQEAEDDLTNAVYHCRHQWRLSQERPGAGVLQVRPSQGDLAGDLRSVLRFHKLWIQKWYGGKRRQIWHEMILIKINSSTPVREPTGRELLGKESEFPEPSRGNQDREDAGIRQIEGRDSAVSSAADYRRKYSADNRKDRLVLPSLLSSWNKFYLIICSWNKCTQSKLYIARMYM